MNLITELKKKKTRKAGLFKALWINSLSVLYLVHSSVTASDTNYSNLPCDIIYDVNFSRLNFILFPSRRIPAKFRLVADRGARKSLEFDSTLTLFVQSECFIQIIEMHK